MRAIRAKTWTSTIWNWPADRAASVKRPLQDALVLGRLPTKCLDLGGMPSWGLLPARRAALRAAMRFRDAMVRGRDCMISTPAVHSHQKRHHTARVAACQEQEGRRVCRRIFGTPQIHPCECTSIFFPRPARSLDGGESWGEGVKVIPVETCATSGEGRPRLHNEPVDLPHLTGAFVGVSRRREAKTRQRSGRGRGRSVVWWRKKVAATGFEPVTSRL